MGPLENIFGQEVPDDVSRPLDTGETNESVDSLKVLFEGIKEAFPEKDSAGKASALAQLSERLSDLGMDTSMRQKTGGQLERVKEQQELASEIKSFIQENSQ